MKDRVREAVFNLIGPDVVGMSVFDWFAGTGALALEALSRGAREATFVEYQRQMAAAIGRNIAALEVEGQTRLVVGDAFQLCPQLLPVDARPTLHFLSPPYAFFVERAGQMQQLIECCSQRSAPDSLLVVEADERFDVQRLPQSAVWRTRCYRPAVVMVGRVLPH